MKKPLFAIITVLIAMQTSIVHAYSKKFDENCLKYQVKSVKAEGCKALTAVQPQFRNPDIGSAREYFCNEQPYVIGPKNSAKIVINMSDKAIGGLIDTQNSLPIGDRHQLKLNDRISEMMYVRTDMHLAVLNCSLAALPLPFDKGL